MTALDYAWMESVGQQRMLLVEDEEFDRAALRSVLEHYGLHDFVEVRTGEDAIEFLEDTHFSAVFVNLRLAGQLNGIDVISWMHSRQPHVPVIIVTGYDYPYLAERAQSLGVLMTLFKPFTEGNCRQLLMKLGMPIKEDGYVGEPVAH